MLPKDRKGSHPLGNFYSLKNESPFEEGTTKNEKEKERSVIWVVYYSSVQFSFIFKVCPPLSHVSHAGAAFWSVCTAYSIWGEVRHFEIHHMDPG